MTIRIFAVCHSDTRSSLGGTYAQPGRHAPLALQKFVRRSCVAYFLANFWTAPGSPSCTPAPHAQRWILYQNDAENRRARAAPIAQSTPRTETAVKIPAATVTQSCHRFHFFMSITRPVQFILPGRRVRSWSTPATGLPSFQSTPRLRAPPEDKGLRSASGPKTAQRPVPGPGFMAGAASATVPTLG